MTADLIGDLNYPKTSCPCSSCAVIPEPQDWPNRDLINGSANNMGLQSADQLNDVQECTSVSSISNSKVPVPWLKDDRYRILNPDFGLDFAPGFYQDPNVKCECPQNPPTHKNVTSSDPRLVYTIRGPTPLSLDRPPYTGNVLLKDIYEEKLDGYGKGYTNYKTINGGQIMYYLDKDLQQPYFLPVSTVRSNVRTEMFQTPMTSYWPTYEKTPFTQKSRYISPQQFTRDTVTWREDMMSLQSSKMLRQSFAALCTS